MSNCLLDKLYVSDEEINGRKTKEGLEEIKQQPGPDKRLTWKKKKKEKKNVTDIEERKNKGNAETAKARNGMDQWNETKLVQRLTEWEQGEIVFT